MFPVKEFDIFSNMISWLPANTLFIMCPLSCGKMSKSMIKVHNYHKKANHKLSNFYLIDHWKYFSERKFPFYRNCRQRKFRGHIDRGLLTSGMQIVSLATVLKPKSIKYYNLNLYYPDYKGYINKPHFYELDKNAFKYCIKEHKKRKIDVKCETINPEIRSIVNSIKPKPKILPTARTVPKENPILILKVTTNTKKDTKKKTKPKKKHKKQPNKINHKPNNKSRRKHKGKPKKKKQKIGKKKSVKKKIIKK